MVVNRRECSAPVTVIDVSRVSICCIASFLGGLLCHVHIVVNWRALLYGRSSQLLCRAGCQEELWSRSAY